MLEESIRIPGKAASLEAFRKWARSAEFPSRGRYSFLGNEVWVDRSPEQLYSHNGVKGEVASVLTLLLKDLRLGRFFHDRVLVTNAGAGLSTEPDGTFVSFDTFRSKRVRRVRGSEGYMEIVGSPDMTLEVVSSSSVQKDTVVLRELYWMAGVREYWLIDARKGNLSFEVLRHTKRGYVGCRSHGGWLESPVFGKAFKLTVKPDEIGDPEYMLRVR